MPHIRSDIWLGLLILAFALISIFLWIPLDSETGFIEKVRNRYIIGDSFAPTLASILMALSALNMIVIVKSGKHDFDLTAARSLFFFMMIFAGCLVLMRYAGPATISVIDLFTTQDWTYRLLRGTLPYRYIGFLIGGTTLIAGLGWFMDGQISRRIIIRSFIIAFLVAAVFDLPFEDIILPPNGDV